MSSTNLVPSPLQSTDGRRIESSDERCHSGEIIQTPTALVYEVSDTMTSNITNTQTSAVKIKCLMTKARFLGSSFTRTALFTQSAICIITPVSPEPGHGRKSSYLVTHGDNQSNTIVIALLLFGSGKALHSPDLAKELALLEGELPRNLQRVDIEELQLAIRSLRNDGRGRILGYIRGHFPSIPRYPEFLLDKMSIKLNTQKPK